MSEKLEEALQELGESIPASLKDALSSSILKQIRVLNATCAVVESCCSPGFDPKKKLPSALQIQESLIAEYVNVADDVSKKVVGLRRKFAPVTERLNMAKKVSADEVSVAELVSKVVSIRLEENSNQGNEEEESVNESLVDNVYFAEGENKDAPKSIPTTPGIAGYFEGWWKSKSKVQEESKMADEKNVHVKPLEEKIETEPKQPEFEKEHEYKVIQVETSRKARGLRRPRASVAEGLGGMAELQAFRADHSKETRQSKPPNRRVTRSMLNSKDDQ